MKRPRYPLLLRLACIESELSDAARLVGLMTDDFHDAVVSTHEVEQRVTLMAAVVGSALLICGLEGGLVFAWLESMEPGGEPEEIDRLTGAIIQQIVTAYGPQQGQG